MQPVLGVTALLHEVVIEGPGHHHQRLVYQVHDAILDRDVGLEDPGHHHPCGMNSITHNCVGPEKN